MNKNLKKFTKDFKPTDGVDFVEYDQHGFKVKQELSAEDAKYDYRDFIAKDGDNAGFEFV